MILDIEAHPECNLEARGRIRLKLAKVGNSTISVGSEKFDIDGHILHLGSSICGDVSWVFQEIH